MIGSAEGSERAALWIHMRGDGEVFVPGSEVNHGGSDALRLGSWRIGEPFSLLEDWDTQDFCFHFTLDEHPDQL